MSKNRVLIVEDDEIFIQLLERSLLDEGFQVLKAYSAQEAQHILSRPDADFGVVLLDWVMPEMSGMELLKWIKQQPRLENVEVIMQTGLNNSENVMQGIEEGAFFYITKPFKKQLLLSTVRSAMIDHERRKELLDKIREDEHSFRLLDEGVFKFRTLNEGDFLITRIAHICEQPETAMYLNELFTNAVEHGNLGIGYERKSELLENGKWEEEIKYRLQQPENKNKFVRVHLKKINDEMMVRVEDEGQGFDYTPYLKFDDDRIFDTHGRGIAITNTHLHVKYSDKGNTVEVRLPVKKEA
jgi:CheY-like chemotaxis protein